MAENFPQDEFDQVAPAAGARRARRSGGSKFLEFVSYFTVSAIIAGGGLFGYQTFFGGSSIDVNALSDNGKTTTDSIRINETTIFDGVGQDGLAGTVAHKLIDKGWNVVTAANVPLGLKAEKTIIYINSDTLQDAAKALVGDLGSYTIEVSNQYIDPITVVLGADYK
ncbi:MAG: hypothetical protein RL166_290 [Actinomycetota bacterium]|jgi:hypothetical protein